MSNFKVQTNVKTLISNARPFGIDAFVISLTFGF
jgi:hypothetical protein